MKILTPGHRYELANFENPEATGQVIQFIEKVSGQAILTEDDNGMTRITVTTETLITVHDGTTNEEVLSVLIDRCQNLHAKFPSRETAIAITKMEEALMWLEKRTRDRIKRGVEGQHKL
jgi:hypothetical protein